MTNSNCSKEIEDLYDKDVKITTDNLNSLYKAVLETIGVLRINPEGIVCRITGNTTRSGDDELLPTSINEKTLVLPTYDNLRSDSDYQFFHPLSENVMKGESLVISTLIKYIVLDINTTLIELVQNYAALISTEGVSEEMNTDQLAVARRVGLKDAKYLDFATSVRKAMIKKLAAKEYPVSLFLKPKARIHEKVYNRGCIINFELSELYDEDACTYADVKETRKNKGYSESILKTMKEILPDFDKINQYSYGTFSKVAPYFCALIGGWYNVRKAMAEFCELHNDLEVFRDICSKNDFDWYKGHEKFEEVIERLEGLVPSLEGNIGSGGVETTTSTKDRAALMQGFLDEVAESKVVRKESDEELPWDDDPKESVVKKSSSSMINPNLLVRPAEPKSIFGQTEERRSGSGFGSSQNTGFGRNEESRFGSSSGFGSSNRSAFDNRPTQGVATNAARATVGLSYNGPKL